MRMYANSQIKGLLIGFMFGLVVVVGGLWGFETCILPMNYDCSFFANVLGGAFGVVFAWVKPIVNYFFRYRQDLFITVAWITYIKTAAIFVLLFSLLGWVLGDLYKRLKS